MFQGVKTGRAFSLRQLQCSQRPQCTLLTKPTQNGAAGGQRCVGLPLEGEHSIPAEALGTVQPTLQLTSVAIAVRFARPPPTQSCRIAMSPAAAAGTAATWAGPPPSVVAFQPVTWAPPLTTLGRLDFVPRPRHCTSPSVGCS